MMLSDTTYHDPQVAEHLGKHPYKTPKLDQTKVFTHIDQHSTEQILPQDTLPLEDKLPSNPPTPMNPHLKNP